MEPRVLLETVIDGAAALVVSGVLAVIYSGWLTSYRTPKAAVVGSSLWFRLPAWGQIAAGLGITVVGAYCGYLLWLPIPIALPAGAVAALRLGGFILLLGGAALFLWARLALGAMYNASSSSAVQLHADHRLIQHGPFSFVRHPIYLSYWLMLFGLLILYRTWMPLIALIMMVASLTRRARREEQVLQATFGDEWREYARRVPMFLPRLGAMKPPELKEN